MTIIITLIGADARFSASVEQLLKLKTKGRFTLGDHGDVTLIDADSIDGRKAIDHHLDNRTVILTVSPEHFEHSLIVRKPIKIEELLKVLENIVAKPKKIEPVEEVVQKKATASSGNPFAKFMDPEYLAKRKQQEAMAHEEKIVEKAPEAVVAKVVAEIINEDQLLSTETTFSYWHEHLKEIKKINPYIYDDGYFAKIERSQLHEMSSIYSQTDDIYYDMSNYASVQLFKKIQSNQLNNHLYYFEMKGGIAFLFSDGVILSNLAVEDILVFAEMQHDEIKVQKIESKTLFMELINLFDQYHYSDSLNALSRAVLLAAKGRIINHKNIKEPLGLMRRKESANIFMDIPFSKELESVWGFRNVSLRDTAELLPEVNPYYIFSYYTLCELFGFFDNELVDNKSKNQLDLNALLSELQKL
ncbi:MAG: hypothetical protein ACRCXK_02275 [Wohlfahrtiimonas sp.]